MFRDGLAGGARSILECREGSNDANHIWAGARGRHDVAVGIDIGVLSKCSALHTPLAERYYRSLLFMAMFT